MITKKPPFMDDLIYIDLALDIGLLHLLRRRHDKLPDKASTRRPPIASHAVVRNVHTLTTPDRPPRQHKKSRPL